MDLMHVPSGIKIFMHKPYVVSLLEQYLNIFVAVLDMYIAILNVLENNYPETLQGSYIINCEQVVLDVYESSFYDRHAFGIN
jgi:hypothetical protein